MRLRSILLIVFALVAAGVAVLAVRGYLNAERAAMVSHQPEAAPAPKLVRILVAKSDMPAGRFMKVEDMRWQDWPDTDYPSTYVVEGERPAEDFAGAVVRNGITSGEPVTDSRVVKPGDRGFLAAVLMPGLRAISVPINATSGISGFVFPGDRVDLIVTHSIQIKGNQDGGSERHRASETVLQNVRVLAVDQRTEVQDGDTVLAKTVTLEVTPKQVEIVAVAAELGKLSLSLRSLAVKNGEENKDGIKAIGRRGRSHTMDSEISRVIGSPQAGEDTVQIVKGKVTETVGFRKR